MKCVICHNEDIETKEVREELRAGDDVVYVPLRTLVCQTCGERYYDRRTMQYLQKLEKKLKQGKVRLQEIGKVLLYKPKKAA
jgi:YgiT-type zinc finger domain-containing protein